MFLHRTSNPRLSVIRTRLLIAINFKIRPLFYVLDYPLTIVDGAMPSVRVAIIPVRESVDSGFRFRGLLSSRRTEIMVSGTTIKPYRILNKNCLNGSCWRLK